MKQALLLLISGFIILGCNSTPNKTDTDHETTTTEKHDHDEHAEAIELNGGQKWIVNEEMKPFVAKGELLVNTYVTAKLTDHQELAKQLKTENDALIKSCTMKGKDHDELHKWLAPHLGLVEELEKETDPAKAAQTVTALQKSYVLYHEYFN